MALKDYVYHSNGALSPEKDKFKKLNIGYRV